MKFSVMIACVLILTPSAFATLRRSPLEVERIAVTSEFEAMQRGAARPSSGACLLSHEFLVLEQCAALFDRASSSAEAFDIERMNALAVQVSACLRSYRLPCVTSRAYRLMRSVQNYGTYFGIADAVRFFGPLNDFIDTRVNVVSVDIALFMAAGAGDVAFLHEALNAGANINFTNHRGCSVLAVAIQERQLSTVKVLLDAGVEIDEEVASAAVMAGYSIAGFAACWQEAMACRAAMEVAARRRCACLPFLH